MADHFSCIGYDFRNSGELRDSMIRAATDGIVVAAPNGYHYILHSPGAGVELWIQADHERRPFGCNPHFSGESRLRTTMSQVLPDPDSPLDGSLQVLIIGRRNEGYPLWVDVPDYARSVAKLKVAQPVSLQVAAFANQLRCFAGDSEFQQSGGAAARLTTESIVSVEPSTSGEAASAHSKALAIITGYVRKSEIRNNIETGKRFRYLLVQTLGGNIDVVAPLNIFEGFPVIGGVMFGSVWLSGRVIS